MKKIFKGTVRKIITILLILVCLAGVAYLGIGKYTTYMNKTTKLGFENIGELATQSAYCTGVGSTDDWRKMFGSIKIPFTESKYVFSCDDFISLECIIIHTYTCAFCDIFKCLFRVLCFF